MPIENLDQGDELGTRDTVECCGLVMDDVSGDLECSDCGSTITLNSRRVVVDLAIA